MVPPPPPFSSTSPFSPTSGHHHVSLPNSVEQLIARICTEKSVPPPDYLARQELARLGEFVSVNILKEIASRRVYNFSGFIMDLAKNSPIGMAHNAEGLSTRQSCCFSGPPVGGEFLFFNKGWIVAHFSIKELTASFFFPSKKLYKNSEYINLINFSLFFSY